MKLGCFGCLALIIVLLVLVAFLVGGVLLSVNIFSTPDIRPVPFSRGDGYSAQQKLYEVTLRQAGRSSRKDPIVLSEQEANAFLARHLAEGAGVPVSPLIVRFSGGQVFVQGQTPLKNLFQGPPFPQLLAYLPDTRLSQPVWVTVRGRIDLETSAPGATRHCSLTLTELALGRQPLSSFLLYVMMGPSGAGLFRWPVPAVVTSIQIQEGELVIRTR